MKKIFALATTMMVATYVHAFEPEWQKLQQTFNVKGGVGIEQFVKSLGNILPQYLEPENFDKKNGYFSFFEEGDGHYGIDGCYWNRSDGKKLFILSYTQTETYASEAPDDVVSQWGFCNSYPDNDDHYTIYDSGCMTYLYNDATKQLVPMAAPPFNGLDLNCRKHYYLKLPQSGKDIAVYEKITDEIKLSHTLKWNGKSFDFVKSPISLLELYTTDTNGEKTNIRNAPNGKVVDALPIGGAYSMFIDKIQNGWCHIYGGVVYEAEADESRILEGDADDYWIHNSVIGATGKGSGSVTLRKSPTANAQVVFQSQPDAVIHPIEVSGDWVKVNIAQTKTQGWMLIKDICSNPLTTCP